MPGPLPSSMATGAPPAIAVNGAAAETTKNAIPNTPSDPRRSFWASRLAMSEDGSDAWFTGAPYAATSVLVGARQVGFANAAELPVAALGGGEHFLGLGRLGADVGADRGGALHDVVAQRAEPLDLHLHHVAGVDGPRDGRGARHQDVAGLQRDGARDVSDQVVH